MKDSLYISELFDYYGELLTDRQIEYFKDYYFDNLTLSEISENNNVSRNAVHKTIKDAEEKLEFYENKLNLVSKSKKIRNIIDKLDDNIKEQINKLI